MPASTLSVDRRGEGFVAGHRTTVASLLGGDDVGRPGVLVLGQLSCRPCMEELPLLGIAAREHPTVRIVEVLFEGDWDGRGVPYAGGNAARIGESGIAVAAVAQQGFERLVSTIDGLRFPAFVYVSAAGVPDKICFGAVAVTTPEGRELNQWLNRASVNVL
jgi:hypothetical protein